MVLGAHVGMHSVDEMFSLCESGKDFYSYALAKLVRKQLWMKFYVFYGLRLGCMAFNVLLEILSRGQICWMNYVA